LRAERDSLRSQLEASRREAMDEGNEKRAYEAHYLNECGRTKTLTAQLEAAEKRLDQREQVLGMYIDKLHEAHKRINALSKPASCRFCGGDTHAQLTAQPDGGLREAAEGLLTVLE
uniref:hypothetical protein n=1 Tax=Klebsiella pneumoniae TaxID=573 RepID=UPI0025561CBB